MKGSIDTEDLNIQTVPSFIEPQMVEAETYDFDISPTMNRGASVPEPSVLTGIELDLRTKESTGRAFGAEIFPQTFEGEFPFALAAGAVIVTVIGGVIAYGLWQASKALEFGRALAQPGIEIAGAIAEQVTPKEAVKASPE